MKTRILFFIALGFTMSTTAVADEVGTSDPNMSMGMDPYPLPQGMQAKSAPDSAFQYVGRQLMDTVKKYPDCKEAVKCFVDDRKPAVDILTGNSVSIHFYKYDQIHTDANKKKKCPVFDTSNGNPMELFSVSYSTWFYGEERAKVLDLCRRQKVEVLKDPKKMPQAIPNPKYVRPPDTDIGG
jgi:hypothetical protein